MEKGVALILQAICLQDLDEYRASIRLESFCREFGVGRRDGRVFRFDATTREKIKGILAAHNYDWRQDISAFNQMSRAEVSQLSGNEKDTSRPVRVGRVAIKSLPGRPLLFSSGEVHLPPGANLDVSMEWIAANSLHESVLVIENWECFERSHEVGLLLEVDGNPLVVYRGDKDVYSTAHSYALLKVLKRPVIAFVDFDPAGILIAKTLPYFEAMLVPSDEVLNDLLEKGCPQRFSVQYSSHTVGTLESLESSQLRQVWGLIKSRARAAPQEKMISKC